MPRAKNPRSIARMAEAAGVSEGLVHRWIKEELVTVTENGTADDQTVFEVIVAGQLSQIGAGTPEDVHEALALLDKVIGRQFEPEKLAGYFLIRREGREEKYEWLEAQELAARLRQCRLTRTRPLVILPVGNQFKQMRAAIAEVPVPRRGTKLNKGATDGRKPERTLIDRLREMVDQREIDLEQPLFQQEKNRVADQLGTTVSTIENYLGRLRQERRRAKGAV